MKLSVSSNVSDTIGYMARLSTQYRFAVAKALTDTVRAVHRQLPAEAERALDRPTPYTKGAFFLTPARKDTLEAVVGVKPRQSEYLIFQVEGGVRAPRKKALRLPSVVQLDAYGNVPAGLIRQLVKRAKSGKRATRTQAARFGVSQEARLFYGDPEGDRPAGIYQRAGRRLVPVISMPQQSARYQKRFDFYALAERQSIREFPKALDAAWRFAKATAK